MSGLVKQDDLPEGWYKGVDNQYNRPYYFHKKTRRSTWTKPTLESLVQSINLGLQEGEYATDLKESFEPRYKEVSTEATDFLKDFQKDDKENKEATNIKEKLEECSKVLEDIKLSL